MSASTRAATTAVGMTTDRRRRAGDLAVPLVTGAVTATAAAAVAWSAATAPVPAAAPAPAPARPVADNTAAIAATRQQLAQLQASIAKARHDLAAVRHAKLPALPGRTSAAATQVYVPPAATTARYVAPAAPAAAPPPVAAPAPAPPPATHTTTGASGGAH